MAAKRVFAVLAAALLVIGAVFLRDAIDDSDGDDTTAPSGGDVTVACIEDLADVCRQVDGGGVDIVIQSFSATLDDLAAGRGPDAWVTFSPLERLAVDAAGAAPFETRPRWRAPRWCWCREPSARPRSPVPVAAP